MKTFQVKPSICTRPVLNIELRNAEIVIVLEDNDVLETKLESCLNILKKNSEVLRSEWASLNDEAKMVCRQIVETRRSQIVAERERDAKRSFPIN